MHKRLPAELIKERLLEAAEQVFSRSGYSQAKLDEIIELADTGKGTLYKYFGNKDDLFYTLVLKKHKRLMDEFFSAEKTETDVEKRMYRMFEVWTLFLLENSVLWQVLCFEMTGGNRGYFMTHDEKGNMHLNRAWGDPLQPEMERRFLRYAKLMTEEVKPFLRLLIEGRSKGTFCMKMQDAECANSIFFGIAMTIFHSYEHLEAGPETAKALACEFVRSVLYGIKRQDDK